VNSDASFEMLYKSDQAIANMEVERLTAQQNLSNNASVDVHEMWLEACPSCARFPSDV